MTDLGDWRNTTHDWAAVVDLEHLEVIRRRPRAFAPGGTLHLIVEVLSYCFDEAQATGGGSAAVTVHTNGSVLVADAGRGTDTRYDERGRPIRKPVMATADLRFFDSSEPVLLPDGHPRRGMSIVAALSDWLVHTNRRREASWTQRYEHGVPVTDLLPVTADGTTGTAVHFKPDPTFVDPRRDLVARLREVVTAFAPDLAVVVVADGGGPVSRLSSDRI